MPQVPTLNRQIDQSLGPQVNVTTNAPIEAFGGGAAREGAFRAMNEFAQKVKDNADHVAVLEAEKRLNDFETNFLYDQKSGAFLKQGKDALGLPKKLNEDYEKLKAEISGSLTNESQQAKFDERAAERKSQLDKSIMRHVSNEIQRYDDNTTQAIIESEHNAAVLNYQDPQRIGMSIDKQKKEFALYAERHGLPPEVIRLKSEELESKTHSSIISRMIDNGDDLTAESYLKANKNFITGDYLLKAEQAVEAGSLRGKSQRFVDSVMSKGMSQSQALSEAAKVENPKLRDAMEQRVQHMYGIKEMALQRDQEKTFEKALSIVQKTGDINQVPQSMLDQMNPKHIDNLSRMRNENPIRDDGKLYYKALDVALDNPEAFAKKDLYSELWTNLSSQHFDHLKSIQNKIREGKGAADPDLKSLYSRKETAMQVYRDAGLDDKNDAQLSKYQLYMGQQHEAFKEKNKREPTVPEIREFGTAAVRDVVTSKGFLWDSKAKPFLMDVDSIPESDRKEIESALVRKGIKPTDFEIKKIFSVLSEKRNKK